MGKTIVVRFAGDSGDGMQLLGEQLTITAVLSGCEVCTVPDFPAEIRAPKGTVAGVSGFQIAMSDQVVFTAGESLDVLVALNPAALRHSLEYLKLGGLLIINQDGFTTKDWSKSGVDRVFFQDTMDNYQLLQFPLVTQTIRATKNIEITNTEAKKTKNFYVLGLILWLFDLSVEYCNSFIHKKFANKPLLMQANELALKAGYNYAMTLELSRQDYILTPAERKDDGGTYRQITGIEAISLALATVAVGTNTQLLVAGYPITPASALLHECAQLSDFGINLFQAEDEISAIGACLGASFGGCLALTCTSGPGMDLKSESLGLAVVTELPLVVLDVQRAGASTGLPTKIGQSDLQQALYGRHGEAPVPIIAAASPADCFVTIIEAFRIAIRYMTPVLVLLDAYLASATQLWSIPLLHTIILPKIQYNRFKLPYQRDEYYARSWNIPGTAGFIHQIGGLEKQGAAGKVSYDAQNHATMVSTRAAKVHKIADEYAPLQLEGHENATVLLIGWGGTYGSLKSAINVCIDQDISLALLHLRYLYPLPKDLAWVLQKFKRIIVAELNTGHLWRLLRSEYLVDAKLISQCNGQMFTTSYLVKTLAEYYYA